VIDTCGSGGYGECSVQERREYYEERLDRLDDCLGPGRTESLRTRWAEELELVHGQHLDNGYQARAAALEERLAAELCDSPSLPMSELVRRQHLAWARVCLDSVHHQVTAELDESAWERLPELMVRSERVATDEAGALVLARARELAQGLEHRRGEAAAAQAHLEHLRVIAERFDVRSVRKCLARVLLVAIRAHLDLGEDRRAHKLLAQLRMAATRDMATEAERTAFVEALLVLHDHAEPPQCIAIEYEMSVLASRPGADQRQRNAWSQALAGAQREGRRILRPPLEFLRVRAYRSINTEDLGALFDRLEADLPQHEATFLDLIAILNEMRALAKRPEANPALRLRFARLWLERPFNARRYDYGAVANDRSAHAWAQEAAQRGELEGQVLLGRCLAHARGTPRDRASAATCLRRAEARGSDEAAQLLRTLGVERFPWLRHRYLVFMLFGFAMLLLHLLTQPFRFDPLGVLAFIGLSLAMDLGAFQLRTLVTKLRPASPEEEATGFSHAYERDVERFARKPWRILSVVSEDGMVLAPLAWLGINPFTAIAMGLVFGLAHYPKYSRAICLNLALQYAVIAVLVLPWAGLWAVAMGHVLWDVGVLYMGVRQRQNASRS